MKVAFISRSTLYQVQGGDTIQVQETAKQLENLGLSIHIFLSHEKINYNEFDLLHFFNITRPADIWYHVKKANKPFVVSPILVDYREFDRKHRMGFSGFIMRCFSSGEYIKTIARWMLMKDRLKSKDYLWKGQEKSIRQILMKADMVLPNSHAENRELQKRYCMNKSYQVIPNGVDEQLFKYDGEAKNNKLVICAARIEGIKNQINLIKALNGTEFTLLLIGAASPNQQAYYKQCKKIAASNIVFIGNLSQHELANYYRIAKIHVLPSWFETCGLSSLEAVAMGCRVVITEKGFTREYFGDYAFYCDPADPHSIYQAIALASKSNSSPVLRQKVLQEFTWRKAAEKTWLAYHRLTNPKTSLRQPNYSILKNQLIEF